MLLARGGRGLFAASLSVVAILLAPTSASGQAETHTVNTTLDGGNGVCEGITVGDCTLRDAVTDAANGDTVSVPGGTYVLSNQLGGELLLDVNVTIAGAGARQTIISGNGSSRVIRTVAPPPATVTASVSRVTLTNGNGSGGQVLGGGAVHVAFGTSLALIDSAVTNSSSPQGGGIYTNGDLQLTRVTVSGNQANGAAGGPPGAGGGVYHSSNNDPVRIVVLTASTISGNSTNGTGGGINSLNGILGLQSSTVAANTAASGSGIFKPGSGTAIQDSIIAASSGAACAGAGVATFVGSNNLATDATCAVATVSNPAIGPLANNGGPTNTHALGATSPAIGAASSAANRCTGTDQRGIARPQGAACDIGAFEYVVPRLRVETQVVNNHGGTRDPADFTVHVRAGADVPGSPQPGSATGTNYTLGGGAYTVAADALARYAFTVGGDCAPNGVVTLDDSDAKTCIIVADDVAPPRGRFNVKPKSGIVRIKRPGKGKRFRILREGDQIPRGTTIDTLRGRVTLFAAADSQGNTASADFYGGIFKVGQTKGNRPITTLTLTERLTCTRKKQATTAAKRRRKRRLWGNGSGRFRTNGRRSAATVIGTKWLVEDRCTSTLTRVVRGRVSVRDFVKKKTVIVRKGKRYIARAEKK